MTPDERALLEAAAEQSGASLSEFMRRKSVEAAEMDVLNRSVVAIPAKDWEAFETWINRPAETKERLAKLAAANAILGKVKRAVAAPPRPLLETDDRDRFDCGREFDERLVSASRLVQPSQ